LQIANIDGQFINKCREIFVSPAPLQIIYVKYFSENKPNQCTMKLKLS